jgi:hypothetical protein
LSNPHVNEDRELVTHKFPILVTFITGEWLCFFDNLVVLFLNAAAGSHHLGHRLEEFAAAAFGIDELDIISTQASPSPCWFLD